MAKVDYVIRARSIKVNIVTPKNHANANQAMTDGCLMYSIAIHMNNKNCIGIQKHRQQKIGDAYELLSQLHLKNLSTASPQILLSQ